MALRPRIEAPPTAQRRARKRPFGVYAITAFLFINAVLIALDLTRSYVALAAALGLPRWTLGALADAEADRVLRLLFAGGFIAVSIGIWMLHRWAWAALMILVGISLSEGILRYMRGEPRYLIMLFNVLIVLYLNQRGVRRWFSHNPATRPHA